MEVITHNNPIIILSEDEDDDDDVVLVKEEKVVQDAEGNDDVIFVSEESSPCLRKNKSENHQKISTKDLGPSGSSEVEANGGFNSSHVSVQIFNSALFSLSSIDSILQPSSSTESVLLRTDESSTLSPTNVALIEPLQTSSSPVPQQEVDAGIFSGNSHSKHPESTEKSSFLSAFQGSSLLQTSAKTVDDSSTIFQEIDIDSLFIDRTLTFSSDVVASPPDDSVKLSNTATPLSPSSSASLVTYGERDPVPGTSNQSSNSDVHFSISALDDLKVCIPEKTTPLSKSDSPLPLDVDIFSAEDVLNLLNFFDNPQKEKEQKICEKRVDASDDGNLKDKKISKLVGSADVRHRKFPLVIKTSAITECSVSSKPSQDRHSGTKYDEQKTCDVETVSSDCLSSDCKKLTHKSSMMSSMNTSKLRVSPDKFSRAKYNHSSHMPGLINTDRHASLQSKSCSSDHRHVVTPHLLKTHPYRRKAVFNSSPQTRKLNPNHYMKRCDSLGPTNLQKFTPKSALQNLVTKASMTGAAHWKIVPSEASRRKRASLDTVNDEHPKKKQLPETAEEKPNLKIKLKMISPTSGSATHSKLSTANSSGSVELKNSELRRQLSMFKETLMKAPVVTRSVSENNIKETQEEREIQMCETCCKSFCSQKLAKCCKGHDICATCLEPQVKVILTGDVKQKYVQCPSYLCTQALSFDELRKTLPSFVVDILEKKLDKEYLSYITKWMFTDEQLKTRSEFATLDTKVAPAPTLSMKKYEEVYSQEPGDVAADLPAFWAPMEPGSPVMTFEVVPDTEEYRALACQFYETCPFGDYDIARIFRVQNPILWKYFALKQSEMIQENDGMDVVVKQLYHGTHHSTLEAIARKGFDWRLSGKHGTVYGNGSYFAATANYSHAYTDCAGSGVSIRAGSRPSFMYQPSTPSLNNYSFSSLRHSALWSTHSSLQPTSPVCVPSMKQLAQPGPPYPTFAHRPAAYVCGPQPTQPAVKDTTYGHVQSTSRPSPLASALDIFLGGSSVMVYASNKTSSGTFSTEPPSQNQPTNFSGRFTNPAVCTSGLGHLHTASMPALSLWDSLEDSLKDKTDIEIKWDQDLATGCSGSNAIPQCREKGTANLTKAFARSPDSKTHFMFMAKVLVGRHTGGKSGLKRPPPLDESNPYGKCYDSCVDNIFSPQVYVIFDSNQAYPEYIIEYNWLKS